MLYSYKENYPEQLPQTILVMEVVLEEVTHDVVTDENGFEETITKTEIVGNNVEVEYTAPFTEELLAKAGYVAVEDKPEDTEFVAYVWNGKQWIAEDTEAAKLRTEMWHRIRRIRNNLLVGTDEITNEYINNNIEIPQDLKDTRQSLRDFPQVYETGEIDDWVDKVLIIKNFPIPGTTSSEDYNEE